MLAFIFPFFQPRPVRSSPPRQFLPFEGAITTYSDVLSNGQTIVRVKQPELQNVVDVRAQDIASIPTRRDFPYYSPKYLTSDGKVSVQIRPHYYLKKTNQQNYVRWEMCFLTDTYEINGRIVTKEIRFPTAMVPELSKIFHTLTSYLASSNEQVAPMKSSQREANDSSHVAQQVPAASTTQYYAPLSSCNN